jgi:tetratricopeptide (TPR) repeat protein
MNEDEIRRYLAQLGQGRPSALSVLDQMQPMQAEAVRRCAIPHHFSPDVFQVLFPEWTSEAQSETFRSLFEVSLVAEDASGLFVHEEARNELFRNWLLNGDHVAFRMHNDGLRKHYAAATNTAQGASGEALANKIFHTIGYDQAEGIAELGTAFHKALRSGNIGLCELMLDWSEEYAPILSNDSSTLILYLRGMLSNERRDWTSAIQSLEGVLGRTEVESKIWIRAGLALSYARAQQSGAETSLSLIERACSAAYRVAPELVPEALLLLGRLSRDAGRLEQAEAALSRAIETGKDQQQLEVVASAYNALGSLYRRWNDPSSASKALSESARYLEQTGNKLSLAQVLANLGTLEFDASRWQDGERLLLQALEIQAEIGDRHGEATTLNNLLRGYLKSDKIHLSIQSAERAADLFMQTRDFRSAAITKANLAKIHRKDSDINGWRRALEESATLFERSGLFSEAESKRRELRQ